MQPKLYMQTHYLRYSIVLGILLVCSFIHIKAQEGSKLYINTDKFKIKQGSEIFINGTLEVGAGGNIDNAGNIIITDSLVNKADGLFMPSSFGRIDNSNGTVNQVLNLGVVTFKSGSNQNLINDGVIIFDTIWVDTDTLYLADSINMVGQLEFQKGYLDLKTMAVLLYYKHKNGDVRRFGTIGTEMNNSRIIDPSGLGYIDAEKNLSAGGSDSFSSVGIDPKSGTGITGIRRYHYHDTNVADTSIAKVFELYSVQQDGGEVLTTFKYLDAADLVSRMVQDSLAVWNLIPIEDVAGFDASYSKKEKMYVMSKGNNSVDVINDLVTGNTFFSVGNMFTLGESNCDEVPPVELGGDVSFCNGMLAKLKPFKDETIDWRDYFYEWGTSVEINRQSTEENTVFEYNFSTDSVPADTDFKVWVKVRDIKGCHSTDTINVRVNSSSDIKLKMFEADMSPSLFSVCQGESFYIKDIVNQNSNDKNYTWWFEEDTLSDHDNTVFHSLTVPGDTIKFGVSYKNQNGCKSTKNSFLTVHPLPEVGLTAETPICAGTFASLNNNSTIPPKNPVSSITRFTWYVDTLDKIDVLYGGVSSEKTSTFHSETLKENKAPGIEFLFEEAGWKNIRLEALSNANCVSSESIKVFVNPTVKAVFHVNEFSDVCEGGSSLLFPDSSCTVVKKTSYSWLVNPNIPWINNDTVKYLFPSSGSYDVSLAVVSDSGCADTINKVITIHPNADAGFEANDNCFGATTQVKNISTGADSYSWYLGNGGTRNSFEFSEKYDLPGTYNIKLVADNKWGCADSVLKEIEVFALPEVSFTVKPGVCINEQQAFIKNTSESGLGYQWRFGDGSFSNEKNPLKIYNAPNKYMITLTGTDGNGCKSDSSLPVTIHGIVQLNFDAALASVCEGTSSLFQPKNTLVNLDSVLWMFGDGEQSKQSAVSPTVKHKYNSPGMYLAGLISTSVHGCKDTVSSEVVIYPNPEFDIITEGQKCNGSEIVFRMNEGVSVDEIAYYAWNFGDPSQPVNNISDVPVPSHFYNQPGNYDVALHAITHQGCHGFDTINIPVNPLPEIQFSDRTGTCDQSLELIAGPSTYEYLWHNGRKTNSIIVTQNGLNSVTVTNPLTGCRNSKETYVELSASVLPALGEDIASCDNILLDAHNPGATYQWSTGEQSRIIQVTKSGKYSVIVTDINGCKGYDTVTATINSAPEITLPASFEFCDGESAEITPSVSGGSFIWNTGETTQSILVTAPGYYWIEATNANGCSEQAMTSVTINPLPIVYLGNDADICEDVNLTLNAGNPGSKYLWNTGETTQTLTPDKTGWYSVNVTNTYRCDEKDSVYVKLNRLPVVDLGADRAICDGNTVQLDAGIADSYYWSTNEKGQKITVSEEGEYWVRVTDNNNCSRLSDPISVLVRELPHAPFASEYVEACKSRIIDAQNPGAAYNWHDGNSLRNYYTETSGVFWVDITNAEGCTLRDSVEVYIKPVASLNLPDGLEVCNNSHDFIDAGYLGDDYSYKWNTGSTEQFIKVSGPGWYRLDVTHREGCVVTDSTYVVSAPAPQINLQKDIILCSNSGVVLDAGNPGSMYSWENSLGETFNGQVWEISKPGKYWVYVMGQNGCTNSDTTEVLQTNMSINPHFMVASNVRIGDTIRFVDLSEPEPIDYYWEFGDVITSTDKEPTHIYYVEDTFNVVMTVSNEICSASLSKPIKVDGYNPYYLIKMGLEKQQNLSKLVKILDVNVFPNPTADNITLKLKISTPAKVAYYVYSINGQLVKSQRFDGLEELEQQVDLSGYSRGMYFLRVVTRNEAKTFKILKIN